MGKDINEEYQERTEKLFIAEGEMKAVFSRLGDQIAQDMGYDAIHGMDAVYRYLIDKYHWLPHQVRSLSVDDLSLLFDDYEIKKEKDDIIPTEEK